MNERAIELAKALRNTHWLNHYRRSTEIGSEMKIAQQIDELLDAVAPVPEPVKVDWEKPIQTSDGKQARFLGRLNGHTNNRDHLVAVKVYRDSDSETLRHVRDDGTWHDAGKHDWDIINTPTPAPEPVELKYEVAVGRNGDLRWPAIRLETGLVIILPSCMKFTSQAIAEECGWTFSPWQPASVKG